MFHKISPSFVNVVSISMLATEEVPKQRQIIVFISINNSSLSARFNLYIKKVISNSEKENNKAN